MLLAGRQNLRREHVKTERKKKNFILMSTSKTLTIKKEEKKVS